MIYFEYPYHRYPLPYYYGIVHPPYCSIKEQLGSCLKKYSIQMLMEAFNIYVEVDVGWTLNNTINSYISISIKNFLFDYLKIYYSNT